MGFRPDCTNAAQIITGWDSDYTHNASQIITRTQVDSDYTNASQITSGTQVDGIQTVLMHHRSTQVDGIQTRLMQHRSSLEHKWMGSRPDYTNASQIITDHWNTSGWDFNGFNNVTSLLSRNWFRMKPNVHVTAILLTELQKVSFQKAIAALSRHSRSLSHAEFKKVDIVCWNCV